MKKLFLIALALLMPVMAPDALAQGFLKNLEKAVKKEMRNRVTKELNKQQ